MRTVRTIIINVCRFILAFTFLFSGFVKANDPLGTVLKIDDYLNAWGVSDIPSLFVVMVSIALAFFEFVLGVYLFFGMRRKWVSKITLAFVSVLTLFTVYIYVANPVSDCGCFGDAIILTNGQTLLKNIVLLAAAGVVAVGYKDQVQIINKNIYWIFSTIFGLGIIAYALYCIYALPVIDFRPYKVGVDLRHNSVAANSRPQYDVIIVYEKNGKTIELGIDEDDPDSTWTYVETKRKEVKGLDKNDISDFYIQDGDEDITEDVLTTDGCVFLLIAPDLQTADESIMDKINDLYDYTQQADMEFYCLTASNKEAQDRWTDYTGAEYQIFTSDEVTLKTMVRSNPGLILLKDGVIQKKWSSWNFPTTDDLAGYINVK